jgi:hypothetical protein
MRKPLLTPLLGPLVACTAVWLALLATVPAASPAQPFETGVFDPQAYEAVDGPTALARTRAAGATTVRIWLGWSGLVTGGETKPENFDARNPDDPNYAWGFIDKLVLDATRAGLEPILMIQGAPTWAERGSEGATGGRDPDPKEFAYFAEAAARHYSGSVPGIPRVRRWEAWNEPNLYRYLIPQYKNAPASRDVPEGSEPLSPILYRRMVRGFSRAVHRVHADNLVVAGGLAPYGRTDADRHAVAPLTFMRKFLCLDADNKRIAGCKPISFDVWAHHPYTEGGPSHKAAVTGNASMGDLPAMRRILDAAIRAGTIESREPVKFWVTEFSWETNPPDPSGVPASIHARWMAEAFYRMWRQGISLVVWFKIKDELQQSYLGVRHESGLYTSCESGWSCAERKLAFRAFRFPFVAFRSGRVVRVWGRTPAATPDDVVIEQRGKERWRRLGELHANRNGIFRKRLRVKGKGPVRARVVGPATATGPVRGRARSVPFALEETPEFPVTVFGS